jgi:SagB-type dehydrogenase family enzyme
MKLLWAAQGITDKRRGFRTAPSAGALYPLEVFAFCGQETVKGLDAGVYRYVPHNLSLGQMTADDRRKELALACLGQMWVAQAPACLVILAVYDRTMAKYGKRGIRYADIESGCAAQNIFLMAVAQGLSAGIVGAFNDDNVRSLTGYRGKTEPLLVMPVGYRA